MSLLELPSRFFKKFCVKMLYTTQMDDEHIKTFLVLMRNMEKMNVTSAAASQPSPSLTFSAAPSTPPGSPGLSFK